jgi:hypothetical protein
MISKDHQKSVLHVGSTDSEIYEEFDKTNLPVESDDDKRSQSSKISDWRKPIITYLHDPIHKMDKEVGRLDIKYTPIDDDMCHRTADGLLLKFLNEYQAIVAMGHVHDDGLCCTHQLAHNMKRMLRWARYYWLPMINDYLYYKGYSVCQEFGDIELASAFVPNPIKKLCQEVEGFTLLA